MVEEKSAIIKKWSFVDQLRSFVKSFVDQLTTKNSEQQQRNNGADLLSPAGDRHQLGLAVCNFLAEVLTIFVTNANAAFCRSEMGKKELKKRDLDENALKEYEELAKKFRENSKELQKREKSSNDLRVKNPSVKFGWNVKEKEKSEEYSLKLLIKLRVSVNASQIAQFIKKVETMEKNGTKNTTDQLKSRSDQCLSQIDEFFEDFTKNRKHVAIFDRLVRVQEDILSISQIVKENLKLKQHILCTFLYTFSVRIIHGAIQKANVKLSNGTNSSQQSGVNNDNLIQQYTKLGKQFEQSNNYFGQIISKWLDKHALLETIVTIQKSMVETKVFYEWQDGTFPLPEITQETSETKEQLLIDF